MLFAGITGGVGAGKSEILHYMEKEYPCRVMLTDEIAHDLMEPGTDCYDRLKVLFANDDVYQENGQFDRPALAKILFTNDQKREALNNIVHPAVHTYVMEQSELEREKGELKVLIVESALLIEKNFGEICDELWYIYTSEENRRARLKASRGYSDEKIDNIMKSQLSEAVFRKHCKEIIDNNGTVNEAFAQIDAIMQKNGIVKYSET